MLEAQHDAANREFYQQLSIRYEPAQRCVRNRIGEPGATIAAGRMLMFQQTLDGHDGDGLRHEVGFDRF